MISDPTDPVIVATLALDEAQRAYDAALTGGRGLPQESRHGLATRLAIARRNLRESIYGPGDKIDEVPDLIYLLPALAPVADEE